MQKRRNVYTSPISEELKSEIFIDYKAFLKPLGHNLRSIRIYCGVSTKALVDDLMTKYNFKTSRQHVQLIERNNPDNYRAVSIFYLLYFAKYWQIPLINLFSIDYSIESNLPEHIKLRKKYNKALVSSYTTRKDHSSSYIPLLSSFDIQRSLPSLPINKS